MLVNGFKLKIPLIAKDHENRVVEIYSTSTVLKEKFVPYEIPQFIRGREIETWILIDKEIKDNFQEIKKTVIEFFRYYNSIRNNLLPYFKFSYNYVIFSRQNVFKVLTKMNGVDSDAVGFALIIGKQKYRNSDYYEEIKRILFNKNIISQNVLWDQGTLKNNFARNNIIIQILSKLGIKYFVLKYNAEYDYIFGVDIGKEKFSGSSLGGCTIIYDYKGELKKIVPIEILAKKETLNLERIFETLQLDMNLEGKKILLLRDGSIKNFEKEQLKNISKRYHVEITTLNIKKYSKFRIGNDEGGIGVLIEDIALLLPHHYPYGSKPIKIDNKILFKDGNYTELEINANDLELIYGLSKLNYSSLSSEERILRLPAPVHYAHKFVKALGKGWKIRKDLLEEGCLYFI
ncbi:MAG: hypothetical protein GXO39_05760 [Thermotogae bacterium]|nr:hypothetical protein [Thermotogota bacterium]